MLLSDREIDDMIRLIRLTQEEEIDCDEYLFKVSEFTEKRPAEQKMSGDLKFVEQHLEICRECREEYKVLIIVLRDMQSKISRHHSV